MILKWANHVFLRPFPLTADRRAVRDAWCPWQESEASEPHGPTHWLPVSFTEWRYSLFLQSNSCINTEIVYHGFNVMFEPLDSVIHCSVKNCIDISKKQLKNNKCYVCRFTLKEICKPVVKKAGRLYVSRTMHKFISTWYMYMYLMKFVSLLYI